MSTAVASPAGLPESQKRYFFEKFGLTERLLERCLGEALSAGGDYADLYFESIASTSIGATEAACSQANQPNEAPAAPPNA